MQGLLGLAVVAVSLELNLRRRDQGIHGFANGRSAVHFVRASELGDTHKSDHQFCVQTGFALRSYIVHTFSTVHLFCAHNLSTLRQVPVYAMLTKFQVELSYCCNVLILLRPRFGLTLEPL